MTCKNTRISKILFYTIAFLGTLFSNDCFSLVTEFRYFDGSSPSMRFDKLKENFSIINGNAEIQGLDKSTWEIHAGNFTVLKSKFGFRIDESETLRFVQPSKESIVFLLIENGPIEILGKLEGNGKIFLIARNFGLGKTTRIRANEAVFCNYFPVNQEFWKEDPMLFESRDPGSFIYPQISFDRISILTGKFLGGGFDLICDIMGSFCNTIAGNFSYQDNANELNEIETTHESYHTIKREFSEKGEFLRISLPYSTLNASIQ